jgi:phosphoglycerate-specific signal transduction histidine kinase
MRVALALVVVIPLLSLCFVALTILWPTQTYSVTTRVVIIVFAVAMCVAGFTMLRRYPRNIERLRGYLQGMAEGRLPESIEMLDPEDDISAIEGYLNTILGELRAQVSQLSEQLDAARRMQRTIEAQADELIEAERQRVMIESLGAACHHIGQPATVLRVYLDFLGKEVESAEAHQKIETCVEAVDLIADVLEKLRRVGEYRTVPYRTFSDASDSSKSLRILDIESGAGGESSSCAAPAG